MIVRPYLFVCAADGDGVCEKLIIDLTIDY